MLFLVIINDGTIIYFLIKDLIINTKLLIIKLYIKYFPNLLFF